MAVWHFPQTSTTSVARGGIAACEPWQEVQLGARVSDSSRRATPWTLFEYTSNWSVGIPYGSIFVASAWQLAQSVGTLSGKTAALGSDAFFTSWEPWQSMQMATRASAAPARRWPCTLVQYFAYWSVGRPEARIRCGSLWQLPQRPTVWLRPGVPMKPIAGSMATPIRSEVGSPPWQSAQVTPPVPWVLSSHAAAISAWRSFTTRWQARHSFVSPSGGWAIGLGAGGAGIGVGEADGSGVGSWARAPPTSARRSMPAGRAAAPRSRRVRLRALRRPISSCTRGS